MNYQLPQSETNSINHTTPDSSYTQKSSPNPPSLPNPPITGSHRNYRRHTAMLYATVTAISVFGLISVINLKPRLFLGIQGIIKPKPVITLTNIIDNCQLAYQGCIDIPQSYIKMNLPTQTTQELDTISKHYQFNPSVIYTLHRIDPQYRSNPPSTTELQQIAKNLIQVQATNTLSSNTIIVPKYGNYAADNVNLASQIIIIYLAQNLPSKTHFNNAASPANQATNLDLNFQHQFLQITH